MEGVAVKVPARVLRKRFASKDNGICDRSVCGLEGNSANSHSFFLLRALRVVTRERVYLRMIILFPKKPFRGLVSELPTRQKAEKI